MNTIMLRAVRVTSAALAALVMLAASSGASLRAAFAQTAPITPDPSHTWLIMPLGDSLTEGQNGANGHWSYRGFLQKRMADNGYRYDFLGGNQAGQTFSFAGLDVDHEGRGGYSIGGVENRLRDTYFYGQFQANVRMGLTDNITSYLQAASPEVVLLMAGINDIQLPQGGPLLGPDPETVRYPRLVSMIQSLRPGVKIVLATLLPVRPGVGGFDSARINQLNAVIRQLAQASYTDSIYLADMAALNLTVADFADDLHLSQSGASKSADVWYNALTVAQLSPTATPSPSPLPSATRTPTTQATATIAPPTATATLAGPLNVALTVRVATGAFAPLTGWAVTVVNNGTGASTQATTSADGTASFNLPAGPYQICQTTQPGWVNTNPGGGCFYQTLAAGAHSLQFLNAVSQLTATPTHTPTPASATATPSRTQIISEPTESPALPLQRWLPIVRR